ncbi:MAG: ATP-binding cassette domain-containing protein [Acidobacteriia bacterium]|nr:ATP-binding cassette domain-containing protein [Terriglobia bacterium]
MTHARIGKKIPPNFSLDVDFEIPPGVTALYGPPAAGKTLILETLAGFAQPDSGRILLDDVILFDAAARVHVPAPRRACGYVAQGDSLFPHMTLRTNLLFAAHASPRLERTRRVAEELEKFHLSSAANSRPREIPPAHRLAGAVARALLASPRMLLLDQRAVDEPLLRLTREAFSGPILLVTSDLDLCCAAAQKLILVEAGRIVQKGAPREVVDRPESVDAARLLGIPNIFECTIAALDPGRNSSRLEFDGTSLAGPYIPGHFRGAHVSIAVRPDELRVHPGEGERKPNCVPAALLHTSHRARAVRLEFSGGIYADIAPEEFERQKDNKSWQVEFPPQALKIL